MTKKKRTFIEKDIKDFLLDKEEYFGDLGDNVVLFEKRLSQTKDKSVKPTIADALIISMNKGFIGVEIKTQNDSLTRLKRQLIGYSLVCDYVWVLCHDNHVKGVEDRLKRYKLSHVGIIAYTQFKGKVVGGIYKKPVYNVNKSAFHQLNILWKQELLKLVKPLNNPGTVMEWELGTKHSGTKMITSGGGGKFLRSMFSADLPKNRLIANIIKRFGEEEASRLVCDVFVNYRIHPERALTMKHFRPKLFLDENGDGQKGDE